VGDTQAGGCNPSQLKYAGGGTFSLYTEAVGDTQAGGCNPSQLEYAGGEMNSLCSDNSSL